MERLLDIGEKKLINRINHIVTEHGGYELYLDDASPIELTNGDNTIWTTTDPSPMPSFVQKINMGNYYHSGWLSIVKSISDLAAMGAMPLGVLLSVELDKNMEIADFDSFYKGAVECAKFHGTKIIGGNLKESKGFEQSVAFAIGTIENGIPLKRGKSNPGDILYVVNKEEFGTFWSGIATHIFYDRFENKYSKVEISKIKKHSLKPAAMVKEGVILSKHIRPSFCMDNSDGLLFSVFELAENSEVNAVLTIEEHNLDHLVVDIAKTIKCDPRLWGIGWGSYHLLCSSPLSEFEAAKKGLKKAASDVVEIGYVTEGNGSVFIKDSKGLNKLSSNNSLSGEQFTNNSFWEKGIDYYSKMMFEKKIENLFENEN